MTRCASDKRFEAAMQSISWVLRLTTQTQPQTPHCCIYCLISGHHFLFTSDPPNDGTRQPMPRATCGLKQTPKAAVGFYVSSLTTPITSTKGDPIRDRWRKLIQRTCTCDTIPFLVTSRPHALQSRQRSEVLQIRHN